MKFGQTVKGLVACLALFSLAACVSLGGDPPPPSLLTLSAKQGAQAGATRSGTPAEAIAVADISSPRKLDAIRVPVQVDASTIAYLKEAQWVERPALLFERLLTETLRADNQRLVLDGPDGDIAAKTKLGGELAEMGYDAQSGEVVVQFDALLRKQDGLYRTKRFVARVPVIEANAALIAPALNQAANTVAAQVADWVG